MATPEFRWPMTTMMALSAMMFFALDTPTSGLAWSSYGTSSTLKPVFSRLPLNLSMASCVPSLMPSPSAAWPPLSGLCVAILMVPLPCAVGPDVVRDAADPYEGNADLAAEFPDQRGTHQLEVGLGRRREHRADGDVVGAVGARGLRLLDAVRGNAEQHAGAQQRARGTRGQVVLAQVDAVGADGHREVHAVVHDECDARAAAPLSQSAGHRQDPARGPVLLAQLDHAAAAVDDGGEEGVEVAPARRRPVEDDVQRRVHQGWRRAPSALVKRPSTKAGSFRILKWKGMVVFTPSITVSLSARRMRSIASARSRPGTMILPRSES